MPESRIARSKKLLDSVHTRVTETVYPLLGAGFGALVAAGAMWAATQVHWALGALVTLIIVALILLLTHWMQIALQEKSAQHSISMILSLFLLLVLLAAAVCAWISFLLYSWQIADHQPPADSQGDFVNYYIWLFIDMIPGLDAWKTLHILVPIEPKNTVAGLPVVAFRLFVLLAIIRAFKQWQGAKNSLPRRS